MSKIGKILTRLMKSPDVAASIDSTAKSFAEEKPYRDEMVMVYMASKIAGYIFNIISLWAASSFFYRNVAIMVDNHYARIATTLIIMLVVEIFTVIFIQKSTKFFLYQRYAAATGYTFAAVLLAVLNFNSSVTGIKDKTQERVSRLPQIELAYSADSLALAKHYTPILDSLNTVNATLSKKVTEQNHVQIQANIAEKSMLYAEYQKKQSLLDSQLKLDTKLDLEHSGSKSTTFWLFMIVVQIAMFSAYIFQSFYLFTSYKEKVGSDAIIQQEAEKFKEEINRALIDTILLNLKQFAGHAMHAFSDELDTKPTRAVSMEIQRTEDTGTEPKTSTETIVGTPYAKSETEIGFKRKNPDTNPDANPPKPLGYPNNTEEKQVRKLQENRELVLLILANTNPADTHISNQTTKKIEGIAQKRFASSRAFQRTIFSIINAVGRENVEGLL